MNNIYEIENIINNKKKELKYFFFYILFGTGISFSFSISRNTSKPLNFASGNIEGCNGPLNSGGFDLSI
jgi:hypothetical protein